MSALDPIVRFGTSRRFAAMPDFGRDWSEADISRASRACPFDEDDPEATIRPAGWLQNPRYARYGR